MRSACRFRLPERYPVYSAGEAEECRSSWQEFDSLDLQIDSLVYGLYGLMADEIAVVEEAPEKNSPTIKNRVITGAGTHDLPWHDPNSLPKKGLL